MTTNPANNTLHSPMAMRVLSLSFSDHLGIAGIFVHSGGHSQDVASLGLDYPRAKRVCKLAWSSVITVSKLGKGLTRSARLVSH